MKSYSELKSDALKTLKGNWFKAIGAFVIAMFIPVTLSLFMEDYNNIIFLMVSYIIEIPFLAGIAIYFLGLSKGEHPEPFKVFDAFKNLFSYIMLFFETFIFTYLWTLLLIIPGIIKSLSYSMATYILIENPNMNPLDAITESRRLMDGHKWEYFVLQLSFIGWMLLSVLTFGIGYFWLVPYIQTTTANYYIELKKEKGVKANVKEEIEKSTAEITDTAVVDIDDIPTNTNSIDSDNNDPIARK